MKKTLRRIRSACGLATLFLASSSAHAFCTEFDVFGIGVNCVDEGHKRVTGYIKPILRGECLERASGTATTPRTIPLATFETTVKGTSKAAGSFRPYLEDPTSGRARSITSAVRIRMPSTTWIPLPRTPGGSGQIRQAPAHRAGLLLPYQLDQSLEPHWIGPGEFGAFVRQHAGRVAAAGWAWPRPGRHHPGPGPARWSPGRVVRRTGAGFGDSRFHDE